MKTFMTAFVLTTALLATQALAFGGPMDSVVRDMKFPEPVSEPVTKDGLNPGK